MGIATGGDFRSGGGDLPREMILSWTWKMDRGQLGKELRGAVRLTQAE